MKYWDGCDAAFIGVGQRCGFDDVAIYDYDLLLDVFIAEGMTHEEAVEWVDFNLLGAYIGPDTPIIFFPGAIDAED